MIKKLEYIVLLASVSIVGCISTGTKIDKAGKVVTKSKAFLGLIPIPGTGGDLITDPTQKEQAIAQLAPLIWASIPLIIFGVVFWRITQGRGTNGVGKALIVTGAAFIVTAVALPQIIMYLKWSALLVLICTVGYGLYYLWNKIKTRPATTPNGSRNKASIL